MIAIPESDSTNIVEIQNSMFSGHNDHLDIRGDSLTYPGLLDEDVGGYNFFPPFLVTSNIYGGFIGDMRRLREIDGFPKEYRALGSSLTSSDDG